MSDTGLMTRDIEGSLSVLIGALREGELLADEVIKRCSTMLVNDRKGFIVRKALVTLRDHVQATGTRYLHCPTPNSLLPAGSAPPRLPRT